MSLNSEKLELLKEKHTEWHKRSFSNLIWVANHNIYINQLEGAIDDRIFLLPDLIDGSWHGHGKNIINGKDAAELVVQHFPLHINQYREALKSHIEKVQSGFLGKGRTVFRLKEALKALDREIDKASDPKSQEFLLAFNGYVNETNLLQNTMKELGVEITGPKHGIYRLADTLYMHTQPNEAIITGSDTQEHSLRAVYKMLQELHRKGVLTEAPGVSEEDFIKENHITPREAMIRGASGVVSATLGLAAAIQGIKIKELDDEEVIPKFEDDQEAKLQKIKKLSEAFGLDQKDIDIDQFIVDVRKADKDIEISRSLLEDLPYQDSTTDYSREDMGEKLDTLHEKLYEIYLRLHKNKQHTIAGEDGGITTSCWVDPPSRDDLMAVTISQRCISPDFMAEVLGRGRTKGI